MSVIVRQKLKGKGLPWWVFVNHNGVRRSKKIGDRKAAEAVASRIREEIGNGAFNVGRKDAPTFVELVERWIAFKENAGCAQGTIDAYRIQIDHHLVPVFGERRIDQITRAEICDHLLTARSQGYSASHVNLRLVCLTGVFNRAIDEGVLKENPATGIKRQTRLKNKEPKPVPFDFDEKEIILKTAYGNFIEFEWLYPLIFTAFFTGLRIGELAGLRWGDIDFKTKLIHVQRTRLRYEYGPTKGRKTRKVEMAESLIEVLKAHKKDEIKKGLHLKGGTLPEYVFITDYGHGLDTPRIRRVWTKVLKAAGLPFRKFHATRDTFASHALTKGAPIYWVSTQLGHASIVTTERVYARWVREEGKASFANLLDNPNETPTAPGIASSG